MSSPTGLPSKLTRPATCDVLSPVLHNSWNAGEILRIVSGSIEVTYRQGSPERDAIEAARIIVIALNDLHARQNRSPIASSSEAMTLVLAHLARTDPQRFWVAAHNEQTIGFSSAWVRGDLCYLSGLFVLPEWQGRGLGRGLLERAMSDHPLPAGTAAVMSSAANPVSNRLYARHGMYPLMPVLYLNGCVPARTGAALDQLEVTSLGADDLDDLRAIDGAVTGLDRTPDHAWLLSRAGRSGRLFRSHGTAAGYAYLGGDGTEGDDAVGPVATLRVEDQEAVLGFLLAQAAERGATTATVVVPGHNVRAQRLLWQSGFSFEGATGLYGCSRPFGHFDRYLFAGDALM
jgi:ribosomal protein S18 acetylase RimI-like enzyme